MRLPSTSGGAWRSFTASNQRFSSPVGTRAEQLPEDYRRYLVNSFRETFAMPGVPIRLNLRGTDNPYAEGAEG